jgi:hypothetical protein
MLQPPRLPLLCAAMAVAAAPACCAGQKKPAVVVHVLVDDLGYADLGYKDSTLLTPRIDALRYTVVSLSSYYAWKYCNPSRAMLLTGRYMHRVGLYSNGGAPSLNFTLLPDRLKQAAGPSGMRAVMIGKWHIGQAWARYTPTYRGFDSWVGYYDGDEDYWRHTFPTGDCNNGAPGKGRCGGLCAVDFNNNTGTELRVLGEPYQQKYSARIFGREAVREIDQHGPRSGQQGFFLYLAMQSVITIAAVASFLALVLTEIYLCGVCSRQEILRRNGRGMGMGM